MNKHQVWTPFKHFGKSAVESVRDVAELEGAKVWVNKDDAAETAAECKAMRDASLPEDEYKAYALSKLLLNEPRCD